MTHLEQGEAMGVISQLALLGRQLSMLSLVLPASISPLGSTA